MEGGFALFFYEKRLDEVIVLAGPFQRILQSPRRYHNVCASNCWHSAGDSCNSSPLRGVTPGVGY